MIDGHVHLENGPLTKDYVEQFIQVAQKKGVTQLQILDHTHRFFEFKELYEDICQVPIQKKWFDKKQKNSIQEYHDLIHEIKKEFYPIQVQFGLEVCYTPEKEEIIKKQIEKYPYDFIVGSVHSVHGLLYDMDAFSKKLLWDKEETYQIYKEYFDRIKKLIQSNLFTQVGHPDVIKMYNYDPEYDLIPTYKEIAILAKLHNIKMEDNTGAHYRYHHIDVGLNSTFRSILKEKGVQIITASDAHTPEHIAKDFQYLK